MGSRYDHSPPLSLSLALAFRKKVSHRPTSDEVNSTGRRRINGVYCAHLALAGNAHEGHHQNWVVEERKSKYLTEKTYMKSLDLKA